MRASRRFLPAAAREGSASFAFCFGTHEPYRVYRPESGEVGGLPLESLALPGTIADTSKVRSDAPDYCLETDRLDRELRVLMKAGGVANNALVVVTCDNGMPYLCAMGNLYGLGTRAHRVLRCQGSISCRLQGRRPGRSRGSGDDVSRSGGY